MLSNVRGLVLLRNSSKVLFANKHTLPNLPYGYDALEPTISSEIMELHHSKHHQTYVNNLNAAQEQMNDALKNDDTSKIISLTPALKFNGGGHINHSIFWTNLSPNGGGEPKGALLKAINQNFGSFHEMKTKLTSSTVAIQGSGWGWLGINPTNKQLSIVTLANQDALQGTTGLIPLLGIDAWEHAYYLQYKNLRPDYVNAIYDIIDWNNVADRYAEALK